jgi:hypothetical protein
MNADELAKEASARLLEDCAIKYRDACVPGQWDQQRYSKAEMQLHLAACAFAELLQPCQQHPSGEQK